MRGLRADAFRAMRWGETGALLFWLIQAVLVNISSLIPEGDAISAPLAAGQALAECGQVLSVIVVVNGIDLVSEASAAFVRAKRWYLLQLIASALTLILSAALTLMLSRAADAPWLGRAKMIMIMLTACVGLADVVMAEWIGARRLLAGISQVGRECGVESARLGAIDQTRRMFLACCVLTLACVLPTLVLYSAGQYVPWVREHSQSINALWLAAVVLMASAMLVVDVVARIRLIGHCKRAFCVVDELSK